MAVVASVLLAAGCDSVIDPSENEIRTFDGTLQPLGNSAHEITVDRNGEIDVKITALSNPDAVLRVSYGQGGCGSTVVINSGFRNLNALGLGGLVVPGPHCVILSDDLGALRTAATYTLRVSHP